MQKPIVLADVGTLTLTFVVHASLRFAFKFSADLVEKLIETLSRPTGSLPDDAARRRVAVTVIHFDCRVLVLNGSRKLLLRDGGLVV